MKHTKSIVPAMALLISCMLMLTACGASYANDQSFPAASSAASYEMMMEAPTVQDAPMTADKSDDDALYNNRLTEFDTQNRKIVKHSNLDLETKEFDLALEQIIVAIKEQGGYIESQSTSGQSLYNRNSYYERTASISARIPADKLDVVSSEVSGICNVTSRSESIDDITDSYFDVEAHLNSLNMQEERLLEILSKADKLEDVISLEKALSDVRYQIESLTATLRRMDSEITYSYLNMELHEVVEYQSIETAPKSWGERITASFGRSADKIGCFFESLLFFVIEDLPLLLIWIAILGAVVFIMFKLICFLKRKINFKRNKNSPTPTDSSKK